jgi:hypothetical protein
MTVAEILGCASATNKRLKHDAYQTPDWVVEQLCEVERLPSQIWEPCAGEGQLANVLRQHGSKVIETDLDPRTRSQRRLDFLAARRPLAKAVVTNPPYRIATKFIRHALSLGVEYLALLLKADFLNAQERHQLISEIGYPARIWSLTSRPDFRRQGAPPMNCSWFIWDGHASSAMLKLLPLQS